MPSLIVCIEADDYTINKSQKATLRILLVSRVVVGKPHRRKRNATKLTRPPAGFNSVGFTFRTDDCRILTRSHSRLLANPDRILTTVDFLSPADCRLLMPLLEETVVYRNDAIRPAYLVVYSDAPKGIRKLKKFLSTIFSTPLVP